MRLLLKAAISFTASSCHKCVLPNLGMCTALINSPERVWSKRTRTTQLARAGLLHSLTEPDSHTKSGRESGDTRILSWYCTVSKSVGN